jgi:hypothetical protein
MEDPGCMTFEQFVFFLNEDPKRAEAYRAMDRDDREAFLRALNVGDDAIQMLLYAEKSVQAAQVLRYIICWPD